MNFHVKNSKKSEKTGFSARPTTRPPFRSEALDKDVARFHSRKGSEEPLVQSVAVVGALLDSRYSMHLDDLRTLEKSYDILDRAGIPRAPVPELHIYNILAPVRSDFLRAALVDRLAPKADMLVVCGVWGGHGDRYCEHSYSRDQIEAPYENFYEIYWDKFKGYHENREVSISELQSYPGSWPEAANEIGAKIIMTRGPAGIDAVNSRHFLTSSFYRAAFETEEKYEYVAGNICGSIGILLHRDAVPVIQKSVHGRDMLGERILSL